MDAQTGDGEAAVGAVHGLHGEQPGLAGQEAGSPGLRTKLPKRARRSGRCTGCRGRERNGVAGSALVQVLQNAGERAGGAERGGRSDQAGSCGVLVR